MKLLEVDQRGKVRLSMRVVDQETGAELEDTRPPREERPRGEGRGDRDRGPRRDGGGGRDRGPRRDGDGRGDRGGRGGERGDRGPRSDGEGRGDRGDRGDDRAERGRDREDRPAREESGDPEFAPAFLTRNDD